MLIASPALRPSQFKNLHEESPVTTNLSGSRGAYLDKNSLGMCMPNQRGLWKGGRTLARRVNGIHVRSGVAPQRTIQLTISLLMMFTNDMFSDL